MFINKKDSFSLQTDCMEQMSPGNMDMTLQILYSALAESACENRLAQGPTECIDILSRNPNKVAVCLMPVDESEQNVNLSIQLILIESICQEYNIPVVKVDKEEIEHVLRNAMTKSIFGTTVSKKALQFLSDLDCCFLQSEGDNLNANERKLMNMLHDGPNDKMDNIYADFPK